MTPRIGLWGPFDEEDLDGVLAIRVAQTELRRRLPAAEAPAYSPVGDRPRVMDPERPLRPLGAWSLERAARLAEQLDSVVVVGGLRRAGGEPSAEELDGPRPDASEAFFVEGLGTELEVLCPVLWHAIEVPGDLGAAQASRARVVLAHRPYVSVRDELSRRRLEAAGVEREIAVVPHPALLAPRCFSTAVLDRRLAHLRLVGHVPPAGALAVEDDPRLAPHAHRIASAIAGALELRGDVEVVLVETASGGRSDDALAERLAEALPGRVHRLRAAPVEDAMAAVAEAWGVIATSPALAAVAAAYGRPVTMLDPEDSPQRRAVLEPLDGRTGRVTDAAGLAAELERLARTPAAGATPASLTARLDAHFDRIADVAERAAWERLAADGGPVAGDGGGRPTPSSEVREMRRTLDLLRRAHRRRVDELARERYDRAALREEMHRAVMERDETILETRARAADFEGLAAGRQEAVAQLEARLVERRARVDELLGELAESRAAELRRASHEARLQQLRMEDERRLRVLAADLDAQRAEVQRLASLLEETHRQLDQMVRSRSWRLMAPLRTLAALRRRLRGG